MVVKAIAGDYFTTRLCEIFRLDPVQVKSVTLSAEAGEPVMISTELVASEDQAEELLTELQSYCLERIEP